CLLLASGKPEFPVRVNCISSHHVQADREARMPERTVPGHVLVQAEFPSGFVLSLTLSTVNARGLPPTLYGHKGAIQVRRSGDRLEVFPENAFLPQTSTDAFTGL